jgi:sigma-B regulation protein RsbU (phosphoserine phosphatase)
MKRLIAQLRRKAKQLTPKTRAGWIALVSGTVAALLWLVPLQVVVSAVGTRAFATLVFAVSGAIVLYRWFTRKVMWRLRNRLVVTYIFIGVIPVVLLCAIGFLAATLFAGQFSSFVVTSDIQAELKRVAAVDSAVASQMLAGQSAKPGMTLPAMANDPEFPERVVVVYRDGKMIAANRGSVPEPPKQLDEVPREQSMIALDDGILHLRSVRRVAVNGDIMTVICSEPLNSKRLGQIVTGLGVVAFHKPISASLSGSTPEVKIGKNFFEREATISSGSLPGPLARFDFELNHFALLPAVDWHKGESVNLIMTTTTRPSLIYSRLFLNLGEFTSKIMLLLASVAIFFAIIEFAALVIGVRLTQTMTNSVAELYDATQHVNQGNFSHRIEVKTNDQLAALETSFNSMTSSLEKLIAEQKEKQRIESELAIAKEVQALLFPRDITELEGLDVHGVCRPARTVSGDYYDFLPVGPTRLGLAVGDISGKGISAALLMATVHAFVRAYTLVEEVPALARIAVGGSVQTRPAQARRSTDMLSPGTLLAILNQQLYRSTPTEKYATMFLGFYDQTSRMMHYSNAGHLPPLLVSNDGSVRQLDVGGTVVGLFGEMTYPDSSLEMRPGDIFVAYSDGVTEPENDYGEFGVERLSRLVHDNRHLPLDRISDLVIASVMDWIGYEEQPDDVTLVLARAR